MKTIYGLVGAGGHGREIMPIVRVLLNQEIESGMSEVVFVAEGDVSEPSVNGHRLLTLEDFLNLPDTKRFNVAISHSKERARIAEECIGRGVDAFSIVAPTATILDCNEIAAGCMISPYSIVTSNVTIGRFFHANYHCSISHDCIIGDYVTFAPGVRCNGNVRIKDYAYLGAGAIIRQGDRDRPTVIGEGAIVGMGAVVTRDVNDYETVVGNPARRLTTR